ncbi:hypothetical protein D3C80_1341710 [compost metagenome]
MMVRMSLKRMSYAKNAALVKSLADNLQAYRESIRETTWNAKRRHACQADWNRQNIVKIHSQWIINLRTQRECSSRCCWTDNYIIFFKGLIEITFDQGAYLLSF